MNKPRWKNAEADPELLDKMNNLFQQTKFKLPDGQSPQEYVDFYKEHNPEGYRRLQELAR